MSKMEFKWFLFGVAAIVMNVVLPYTVLKEIEGFGGAFLFWCVITLVVIAAGAAVMSRWGGRGESSCR
jgi:hypothetical protein